MVEVNKKKNYFIRCNFIAASLFNVNKNFCGCLCRGNDLNADKKTTYIDNGNNDYDGLYKRYKPNLREDDKKDKKDKKDEKDEKDEEYKDVIVKHKSEVLKRFTDEYLQGLDEKYFNSMKIYKLIEDYVNNSLEIKNVDKKIDDLKKILKECKEKEKQIINEIKEIFDICAIEKENKIMKNLYYIEKKQISNINIDIEDLFSDEDNTYYIYKKYVNDCINNIDVLKNKYKNNEGNFQTKFDDIIKKAKEEYEKIDDDIKNDDNFEKIYYFNGKNVNKGGKNTINFFDILESIKDGKGSKRDYRHIFTMLLSNCRDVVYLKIYKDNGELLLQLRGELFGDCDKLKVKEYEDLSDDIKKKIKGGKLEDTIKKYVKLLISINENINKLDDDAANVEKLLDSKKSISDKIKSYKALIDLEKMKIENK